MTVLRFTLADSPPVDVTISNQPAPTSLGTALGPYLAQPPGLLILADGDYTIDDFPQPASQRTDWLVLQAETPGGVRIVPRPGTTAAAHVGTWTHLNKVLFVGCDFRDVRVNLDGCEDVAFWHCDMSYPAAAHPTPGSGSALESAQPLQFNAGGANPWRLGNRCGLYGCIIDGAGDDAVEVKKAYNAAIVGTRITGIIPPNSNWHDDAVQMAGRCTGLTITDSWITGRLIFFIEALMNSESVDVTVRDTWVNGSPGVGWHCGVKEDTANPNPTAVLTLNRSNVHSWGHTGLDTYEQHHPELCVVNDVNYSTAPGVGIDPASAWRQAHPYDSWRDYFAIG